MKDTWLLFAIGAFLCWGAYVPTIHSGQLAIGGKSKALWAFLFVGVAYFLTAVLVPAGLLASRGDLAVVPGAKGVGVSILAGVLGAGGALCVILALMNGGTPASVPPIVFAGAPIVASIVAMALHPPKSGLSGINPLYFVGILLAAGGAALVLRFKPA
ncbi:MAG: hypothetical protein SF069_03635 [Phycisphaerae bacterium]|nr:hypothetical protein [Phycisphaerae bacterium]